MKKTFVAAVVIFFGIAQAMAQQFSLKHFSITDGLPQSQITATVEDANGYLWIGTNGGGLTRFDGKEFKIYNVLDGMLSNIIQDIIVDNQQHLWIAHPNGVSEFDGAHFKVFKPAVIPDEVVLSMVHLDDSLCIISSDGMIGKIYRDSLYYWKKFFPNRARVRFAGMLSSKQETYFYLTGEDIEVAAKGKRFRIHHGPFFRKINTIFYNGDELAFETENGFFAIDVAKKTLAKRQIMVKHRILKYDALNGVYWTSDQNNLYKEKITGSTVRIDTVLRDEIVTAITIDGEADTWISTFSNGIYKYYQLDFTRFSIPGIKAVMAISVDKTGALWAGTATQGIYRSKNGKVNHYKLDDEAWTHTLKTDNQGVLWVSTNKGLGKYNEQLDRFEWFGKDGFASSRDVTSFDFDDKGGIWLGSAGSGVNYFRENRPIINYPLSKSLISKTIMTVHYSKFDKTVYLGTSLGLSKIEKGIVTAVPIEELQNSPIIAIHQYRDSLLLLGSEGAGLAVINKDGILKRITSKDGLASDLIYFISVDASSNIWIGTEKGITQMTLDKSFGIKKNIQYGYDNGLFGLETDHNAFFLGATGHYFGLIDGVYRFNNSMKPAESPFKLHFTAVDIEDKDNLVRTFSDSLHGAWKIPFAPVLPSDFSKINFHFNKVNKRYSNSIKYKYRMEGLDKTWSAPTASNVVSYSNLPAGKYVFKVLATNDQGSWENLPLVYSLSVKAPFYAQASFIIAGVVIISLMIASLVYYNIRRGLNRMAETERIRRTEETSIRKEIARDFHDEMGNQLTRIIGYISVLKMKGNPGADVELYEKVESSAKYLYSGTRDFLWSIDPENDDLSKLFVHVRDFGVKLFEEKQIQFRAFNETSEKVKIHFGISRQVTLIFKEAMTNVFNHSDASNVSFAVRKMNGKFEIALKDDGVGFNIGHIERVNGIKNMRSRAQKIQSTLRIKSKALEGTEVVLILS